MPNSPRHLAKAPDVFHHLEPSRPDINFNNLWLPRPSCSSEVMRKPTPKMIFHNQHLSDPHKKDNTELYNTALKATGTQLEYRQKILAYPNHHLVMIKWQCVSKTGSKKKFNFPWLHAPSPSTGAAVVSVLMWHLDVLLFPC